MRVKARPSKWLNRVRCIAVVAIASLSVSATLISGLSSLQRIDEVPVEGSRSVSGVRSDPVKARRNPGPSSIGSTRRPSERKPLLPTEHPPKKHAHTQNARTRPNFPPRVKNVYSQAKGSGTSSDRRVPSKTSPGAVRRPEPRISLPNLQKPHLVGLLKNGFEANNSPNRPRSVVEKNETSRDHAQSERVPIPPPSLGLPKYETASRRIVYFGQTAGGIGRQEHCLLEHLAISKSNNFEIVIPYTRNRDGTRKEEQKHYWDIGHLGKHMAPVVVHKRIPASCNEHVGGRWDVRISVDSEAKENDPQLVVSSKVSPSGLHIVVGQLAFKKESNLRTFILQQLAKNRPKTLFDSKGVAPICVIADPHLAAPDFKLGYVIRPGSEFRRQASTLPLGQIAFIHLRYAGESKNSCSSTHPANGQSRDKQVCLRLPTEGVGWIPTKTFAKTLSKFIFSKPASVYRQIKFVYVTHREFFASSTAHMLPFSYCMLVSLYMLYCF